MGKAVILALGLFGATAVQADCSLTAGRSDSKQAFNQWCYELPRSVAGGCTAWFAQAFSSSKITRLCSDPGSGSTCSNDGSVAPFSCAAGDPHFTTAHGDTFDFKGKNDTVYNMLSHTSVSVNARFQHIDFTMPGPRHKLVHGSYMQEIYMTMRTGPSNDVVRIHYAAARAQAARITVASSSGGGEEAEHPLRQGQEFAHEGVKITLNERTLTVNTTEWVVMTSSKVNPNVQASQPRAYLTIGVKPTFDADHAAVAPHGLLGQAYDGDFNVVEGEKDNYDPMVVTTAAMGEGAIEGAAADYEIKGNNKFSTAFAFSRYGATGSVKPRDATKLRRKAARVEAKAWIPTQGA